MSALAAVVSWRDRAAGPLVETLLSWQRPRIPSSAQMWSESPAAALGLTRPNPSPANPVHEYAETDSACLVFDGFVDDREALASALHCDERGARCNDAALALAAFERWGLHGLGRLTGDFALALWDRRQHALVAARDLFGQRPLYYRRDPDAIAMASEAQALVRLSPVAVNEGMVAEFLSSRTASASETLYQTIYRVPAGHAIVARDGDVHMVSLGALDAPPERASSDPDETAAEFRELLTRAVRDRLPPAGSVGVLLSGGMDSSSIWATIREDERGGRTAPALAFTLGAEGDAYNESPYAREVVAAIGGPGIVVGPDTHYDFAEEVAETLLPPTTPSAVVIAALRAAAAERGVRVTLTGVGGDEWFGGAGWHDLDLIRRGQWIDAARRRIEARREGRSVSLTRIARGFLWDAAPPLVQRAVRRTLAPRLYPDWLNAEFVRRVDLAGRPRWRRLPDDGSLAQRGLWLNALSAVQIEQSEEQARFAARFGQEDRQPYFDRRLVRLALSLPDSERSAHGVSKIVQRRAFSGRLPESVIRRTSFFDYSFYVADAVGRFVSAGIFDQSRLAARGWIKETALRSALDRSLSLYRAHGRTDAGDAAALWRVVALELWYRGAERYLSN